MYRVWVESNKSWGRDGTVQPDPQNSKGDRSGMAEAMVWVHLRLGNAWHVAFETKAALLLFTVVATTLDG